MGYKHRILFIEDDRGFYQLAITELAGSGLEFESALAVDRAACAEFLGTFSPDLVIADYHLPDIEGPEILKMALERAPLAPFIVLSGVVSDQKGLELEKLGAFKYLPKDRLGRLPGTAAAAVSKLAYTRPRMLFFEDEPEDYALELRSLDGEGINYLPGRVRSLAELSGALDLFSPNIIVTDYMPAGSTALDVMELARQKNPLTPVIVVSGPVGEEKTIGLFRAGAADFVLKDDLRRLGLAVRRVMEVMRGNISREALERGLREAVEARRVILEAVKAPFFLIDAKGRIVLGNPPAAAALGLPEIAGADISSSPGEYGAKVKTFVQACARNGAPVFAEHKAGWTVYKSHVYPLASVEGEPAQFAVISFDITSQKEAEESLRKAEELQELILGAVGDGIIGVGKEGETLFMNEAAQAMLGWKLEELRGKTLHSVIHYKRPDGSQCPGSECPLSAARAAQGSVVRDEMLWRRDGTGFYARYAARPMYSKGAVSGAVATFSDITERRNAERALRESEARYRALFEQAGDSILVLEISGDTIPVIRDANEAALRMHGYTREELIGKPISLLDAKDTPEAVIMERTRRVVGARGSVFEARHQRKDGSLIDLEVSVGEIGGGGGNLFLDISRDITARNQAAAALKEAAEMKVRFAATVSHELRSPLTSILMGVSLVLEEPGGLGAQQKALLELAHENAGRLGRLINNILDFQKMAAGKMRFDIRENDIAGPITATVMSMDLLAKKKGLELVTDIGAGLPRAPFDADKITQVLTNLLANAIAHTGKGTVTVRAGYEGGMLHVAVLDTGPGIRAGDLCRLFQPFEQLETGAGRRAGGTGLGLAISREIIQAHNGKIWAESESGKGSVFHFTLPVKQGEG